MTDFIDKIDDYLKENIEIDDKFIKKIAHMTDINYHTEARKEIAKKLGNQKLVKIYQKMAELNQLIGYSPQGLVNMQYELDNELLWPFVKQTVGEEVRPVRPRREGSRTRGEAWD